MQSIQNKINLFILFLFLTPYICAQDNLNNSKFKQLYEELPTPNVYRTASGAPGHEYYQQKADYEINVELDEEKNILKAGLAFSTDNDKISDKFKLKQSVQNEVEKNMKKY